MGRRPFFSEPLWQSLRTEQQAFSELFAWGTTDWNIATDGEYRPVRGLYVSGNYFNGLGVGAHIGRVVERCASADHLAPPHRTAPAHCIAPTHRTAPVAPVALVLLESR